MCVWVSARICGGGGGGVGGGGGGGGGGGICFISVLNLLYKWSVKFVFGSVQFHGLVVDM